MAVNYCSDCPDCQATYGQVERSDHDAAATSNKSRAASPENGRASPLVFNPYYTGTPRTLTSTSGNNGIDRQEIIRRIKSGGSRPASPELQRPPSSEYPRITKIRSRESRPASPELIRPPSSGIERKRVSTTPFLNGSTPDARPKSPEVQQDNQSIGLQIERPRSALHRGDFHDKEQSALTFDRFGSKTPVGEESVPVLSTSPVAPWHPQFPSAAYRQPRPIPEASGSEHAVPIPPRSGRARAVSNAPFAASFAYKPPTSPLVQSSRPDTPEPPPTQLSRSPDRSSRRHTFSPQSFQRFQSALDCPTTARIAPPLRSERSLPYQAHQPRRSLNNTPFASLPQSPLSRSRRPSFSETPLHHAPMVGSYEESILRGRMSTTPSKPLNFVAQIGVLGQGDCKSSLKCPPHVQIPFPAVFYSYGVGTKTVPGSDQPSPYVGLVDLENSLPNLDQVQQDRRRQRLHESLSGQGSRANSPLRDSGEGSDVARRRRRQKAKRRSGSPKAPPGGSYRIPQQGQLQIVIKNPNKTAVKLFLVPYDLSDMEPGQKTFIRQRSYSAGPIIDMPLTARSNLGTDRPEASLSPTGDPNDRPMLRYLIHLNICCPSKGRFFLYKAVRVVFANRVPDGKEKLRNETQMPEPRYSTYKAGRDSNAGLSVGKDQDRRRSAVDPPRNISWPYVAQSLPSTESNGRSQFAIPMPALPRNLTMLPTAESQSESRSFSDSMDVDSPSPGNSSMLSPVSPTTWNGNGDTCTRITPLLQDPFKFDRESSRERRAGQRNESLLSKRLMDLAFQKQKDGRQAREKDDA